MVGYVRAITEINGKALQHNLSILRKAASPARVLAIVKSNAYGHGLVSAAKILEKTADGFGVACLGEALQLREAGILNKIVVLEGAFSEEDYQSAAMFDLDMVIHDEYQYEWLKKYPSIKPIQIWLKVNTGLNRLGISFEKAHTLIEQVSLLPSVKSIVVMSHLSHADKLQHPTTSLQYSLFNQIVQAIEEKGFSYSLANSGGILAKPRMHYHWVRPGLALYGVSPFKEQVVPYDGLQSVMTLKAKIIAIQLLKPGDYIGYYGRFQCEAPMRVGIVSLGYGDGYPYNTPSGTPVLIKGQLVPLVGQVCMDMLTVDLNTLPKARVGDEVILWGEGLPIKKIAHYTQRSPSEMLCGIQRGTHSRLHVQIV